MDTTDAAHVIAALDEAFPPKAHTEDDAARLDLALRHCGMQLERAAETEEPDGLEDTV
jgi:hypothetical protein